jgi:cytoskeletal protein CcmA (bactofilin family)
MFRRKRHGVIEVTKLSSLVAPNMEIRGNIIFSGGLRVDGRVQGDVVGGDGEHGLLVLSEHGSIKGNVRVYDAVINGTIEGNLEVEHFVELQAGSRVTGNITYRQLQMDCGATVEGKLDCLGDAGDTATGRVIDINPMPRATAPAVLPERGPGLSGRL